MSRKLLIEQLWAAAKAEEDLDYTADPIFIAFDPYSIDIVTFERKQYGTSIVIEAEGQIVERLCN